MHSPWYPVHMATVVYCTLWFHAQIDDIHTNVFLESEKKIIFEEDNNCTCYENRTKYAYK